MCTAEEKDILEEAAEITSGDRQNRYGPPDQDFTCTANMWSAVFNCEFRPSDVAIAQILLKCSRQIHQQNRDNWIDIAGYARCGQLCDEAGKRQID